MKALVTGATGFIGRRLLATLDAPLVLSRDAEKAQRLLGAGVKAARWAVETEPVPSEALEGIDVIFHLAGESVGTGRWTAEKKRRIMDSRKLATANLVEGIRRAGSRPGVLVCASAVGYYGDRGDEPLTEQSAPGDDFLAHVCQHWEQEAQRAQELDVRVVTPRFGIVLGAGGGALARMLPLFKLGLGGRLGSGQQWMPWVHIDDIVAILHFAAQQATLCAALNATAPNPVTNRQFTQTLAAVLHRPAILPAPAFALRLGIGEFAEVLLGSQRVLPTVLQTTGYMFKYPELRQALAASV